MAITYDQLPGPKGLPLIGNIHQVELSKLHQHMETWADEFGPVFKTRLGPAKITVITDPEIIQTILKDRPHDFVRMKKMDKILREEGINGVFNAEGEEWKLHRKMVAKGLDVRHQKEFFPQMLTILERLYNKWQKNAENGDVIDIQRDFLRFTVDVTTSLAFGYEMNTIEEKGGVVQDHLEKIFPMIFKRINAPIQWHKLMKGKESRSYDKSIQEVYQLIDDFIEAGRKKLEEQPELKENPSNFLEAILAASESEENFGNEEVKGNLLTLLLAGEDTTAHTLAWSIYLLTQSPAEITKMQAEIDQVLKNEKWFSEYADQQQLNIIEGVTNETMRLKPVAPLLLFEPIKDVEIKGYKLAKGSRILVQTRYGAIHDEHFTAAKSFNPDRWAKASGCPMHNTNAFVPFGGGARFCPGKNLAMLEIKMVLSMLFKNFNLEMMTEHEKVDEIMAFTMMASDFRVRLTPRKV